MGTITTNIWGRALALLLSLAMALLLCPCFAQPAMAEGNSDLDSATSYSLGTTISGSLSKENEADFYRFSLPSSGRVTLTANAYMKYIYYAIYDANGTRIWRVNPYWDSTTGMSSTSESISLTAGTYYFAASKDSYGSYNFKLAFSSAGESFPEAQGGSNNTLTSAQPISVDTDYYGQIAINDSADFYRFSLPSSGRVTLTANAYMKYIYYAIYDANGTRIWRVNPYWNSTAGMSSTSEAIDLTAGTYYFAASEDSYRGNYNFKLAFSSAAESFPEAQGGSNNTLATSSPITIGTSYNAQIATNDSADFYSFTLPSSGTITLAANAYMYSINYAIYNSDGSQIWSTREYRNSVTNMSSTSKNIDLDAGRYYFCAAESSGTGRYNFTISNALTSIVLSKSSFTYTGKTIKPSVTAKSKNTKLSSSMYSVVIRDYRGNVVSSPKSVGTYTVTAVGKGSYSGSEASATFAISPKGTVLTSLAGKSGSITVKWKKQSTQTSGYELRCSRYKDMSYASTFTVSGASKTQKRLTYYAYSKTKYYFQVRTYKKVGDTTYYSSWSPKKSLTVR